MSVSTELSLAREFMASHPDARDGVMKAAYAFQLPHPRLTDLKAHFFTNANRWSECQWCGRTREDVRWDDHPPECAGWREPPEIEGVIRGEEERVHALAGRADEIARKWFKRHPDTEESWARLYETHGVSREDVGDL